MDGWMHWTHDLIVYGRPYFDIHKHKDAPSRRLGRFHRAVHHDWYWEYAKRWTWEDPFPTSLMSEFALERTREGSTAAERKMAWISHDVMDRVWDELGPADRNNWQRLFAWLILNPRHLKEWAGVDVLGGWIKRANRSGNHKWWERCARLVSEYAELRRYVEVVVARNSNFSVSESDVLEE